MNNEQDLSWETLSEHYEKLRNLSSDEQQRYIDQHCNDETLKKELFSLLAVDEDSAVYFDSLTKNVISPAVDELGDLPPSSGRVYNYRLLKKIGRGGMGNVYLAERDDDTFKSQVAVKILRRGMDSEDILERFRVERQILAQLNHPNITHLLDGGITSDGRPYFVMEYVEGKTITEYCDDKNLSLEQRIELFKQIFDALIYAHQNLVIHRDLKPGNIYVTEHGDVKLLDFGIAKLLDEKNTQHITLSKTGQRLMTPEYASPEQVKGIPMNTASDIYQLGLVLYKLLCGKPPFSFQDCSLAETESIILKEFPQKPSTLLSGIDEIELSEICKKRKTTPQKLKQDLKGDLDQIILKALHKVPERRFKSVLEFREDIDKYQNGLPVKSRGDSFGYRAVKYVQRNKIFLSVAALFLVTLTLFTIFYNISITEQRNHAQNEAEKAAQVTSFLMELFEANDPAMSQGEEITAWELLQQGEERIELLENQPEVQAQMLDVTGQIYRRLGDFSRAEGLLLKAKNIRGETYGPNHTETLAIYDHLGLLYSDTGNFSKADSVLRRALYLKRDQAKISDPSLSNTKTNLAYVSRRMGNYSEAERLYRQSYEIRKAFLGDDHPSTIENLSSLGVTLINKGDYTGAEQILRQVLEYRREAMAPSHPDLAMSMNNLGAVLLNVGVFSEAESLFRESLEMRQNLFGNLHPKVALTMNNLGISLRDQGNYIQAADYLLEALEIRKNVLGRDNVNTAISNFSLGELKLQTGESDEAVTHFQNAYEIFRSKLSENHSFTARTMMALGSAYLHQGNEETAEDYINRGYEKVTEIHHENSLEMALADWEYGTYLQYSGDYDTAIEHLQKAFETLQSVEIEHSLRQNKILAQIEAIVQPDITEEI
jgi:eukaryotic-like serine/threonine-protein kinase